MIERGNDAVSISRQSSLLSLHRSNFYCKPRSESSENLSIMRFLDEQYFSTPFYGVERLSALLVLMGYRINRKRLRRLPGTVGWQTLYPSRRTAVCDAKAYKYPYLLKGPDITSSNQVWAADITYIPMRRGFLYLFAIIDLHSRYVVGWSLSSTMSSQRCVDTVEQAIALYGVPQMINSDQGSRFTSDVYIQCLEKHQIAISMDGKGRAIDNVFIERLWRSVKYEYVYLHVCDDGNILWRGLSDYFQFYNHRRLHQSLDYRTPFEAYRVGRKAA
jgi:putative transposase